MALFDDVSEGMKKILLAGVGAVAMGAEKAPELLDDLVKKGEEALEQGKTLNEELTRKVKETVRETAGGASDEVLRTKFRTMSAEERAAWIANAQKIADDLEAEDAPVADAEYEVVSDDEAESDGDEGAHAAESAGDVEA